MKIVQCKLDYIEYTIGIIDRFQVLNPLKLE